MKWNRLTYTSHCFFFQAEDGIRDYKVTGVQTCALPISALTPFHFAEFPSSAEHDDFPSSRHHALHNWWSMVPRVEPEGRLFPKSGPTFRDHALRDHCRIAQAVDQRCAHQEFLRQHRIARGA